MDVCAARGDLAQVERKLSEWTPFGFRDVWGLVARLNALVALERRAEIEAEAPRLAKPGTYLEPFALRALAYAREDENLVACAIERFEAMDLGWHAEQTRALLVSA